LEFRRVLFRASRADTALAAAAGSPCCDECAKRTPPRTARRSALERRERVLYICRRFCRIAAHHAALELNLGSALVRRCQTSQSIRFLQRLDHCTGCLGVIERFREQQLAAVAGHKPEAEAAIGIAEAHEPGLLALGLGTVGCRRAGRHSYHA